MLEIALCWKALDNLSQVLENGKLLFNNLKEVPVVVRKVNDPNCSISVGIFLPGLNSRVVALWS